MRVAAIFLLIIFFRAGAAIPALSEVRILYKASATAEDSCKKLIRLLEPYNERENPLLTGYKACATMMMASYIYDPYQKWLKFSDGKSLLEKCLVVSNDNAELRFLRFSMQCSAPGFLGYMDAIDQDKAWLKNSVYDLNDAALRQMILHFFKTSDCLSDAEKQTLK